MAAIITDQIRILNAKNFVAGFSTSSNSYYSFVGLTDPTAVQSDWDNDPPSPIDNFTNHNDFWDTAIALKKINASDVKQVVKKNSWTSGTTYDYYRHDYGNRITGTTNNQTANSGATTLFDATFYVLTAARNVYKCLDNNGGANSTVEPTGTSTSILSLADGYKWKFMYTLSAAQQANFLSTDFKILA